MKCPMDPDVDLVMSERQGVEIDYCPKCRGVWLDRGELDKILERNAQEIAAAAPPAPPASYGGQPAGAPPAQQHPQRSHYHDDYDPRYGRKRKKSFIEQLFD